MAAAGAKGSDPSTARLVRYNYPHPPNTKPTSTATAAAHGAEHQVTTAESKPRRHLSVASSRSCLMLCRSVSPHIEHSSFYIPSRFVVGMKEVRSLAKLCKRLLLETRYLQHRLQMQSYLCCNVCFLAAWLHLLRLPLPPDELKPNCPVSESALINRQETFLIAFHSVVL